MTRTPSQQEALNAFTAFLSGESRTFVLTGAAGTGKTTLLKECLAIAESQQRWVDLIAPTARAARVLQQKTGHTAGTIHAHIYSVHPLKPGPGLRFVLHDNGREGEGLIVVDEASMVPSRAPRGELMMSDRSVLEDLLLFMQTGKNKAKIMFVGDPCQLPPVGEEMSVALNPALLSAFTRSEAPIVHAHLREIVRQNAGSEALREATRLRQRIELNRTDIPLLDLPSCRPWFKGVVECAERFADYGPNETVILAYTNNKVFKYNQLMREVLGREGWLAVDDYLVVDADAHVAGMFLQRGTPLFVERVGTHFQKQADLNFVDLTLRTEQGDTFTSLVLVDLLTQPAPRLDMEKERELVAYRMARNPELRDTTDSRSDPFLSALRLRFGYALTVHKAQGGEWPSVYADLFIPNVADPATSIRWCYTALTRTSSDIVLL